MNLESEISRLLDLMPASGRMLTKLVSKPQQAKVIDTPFPLPWKQGSRYIYINFDLWRRLSRPQRDLILLRAVSLLTNVQWFKPDLYQGVTLAALLGLTLELMQADAIGIVIAGGLTTLAARQIWRNNRSVQREIDADEGAIKVATRRGYTETEAAKHLLSGIETVAQIEGRSSLNFTELIRCQNLRAMANISPVGVPDSVKQE
ncbi:DUF3318 domain-containing protein [Gloeothece verrucosa]|uniref:DUF3318 domain-containing protein n=1 Tax=Gloeothece verrucosa (strain PCC 7822) TaxID=497965 RepID=E0U6R1_GLOV7|nr:DUF3318 domain-containing protein [Gloeothece verrucosa]ADN14820.1 conserved hypothetical protein [Gloeothece verrucosa PCC 7822]